MVFSVNQEPPVGYRLTGGLAPHSAIAIDFACYLSGSSVGSQAKMSDRYNLGSQDAVSASLARWLGFIVAIIAGALIGSQLWRNPEGVDANLPGPTLTKGLQTHPPASATIWVPDQGRLTDRLTEGVQIGAPAPEFILTDINGEDHAFSSYKGSIVLINFWTTWCPPCEYEMPALEKAYEKYRDRGFTILAVNWTQQDDPEQVDPYVQSLGLSFPVLLDREGEVSERTFNIRGLPTSIIIDRKGIIREIIIGPIALDGIDSKIQTYLEELS